MSLNYQTIFVFFALLLELATSDIYKSVMWNTNNPLFLNSTGLSRCYGEDLEMRVHLKSNLPIVCPFEFIVMQTLPSRPATGVLYENFWIVYDKESFDTCNINMTYQSQDGERNKKLHDCDTPDTLKSFTYSIDFKVTSPINRGTAFVAGRDYYFLATSDGTDGSLNNTKGGHCNDTKIQMKFKVYICTDNDVKCQNIRIGEFLCPHDIPDPPDDSSTTHPPTSQPLTTAAGTELPGIGSTTGTSNAATGTESLPNTTGTPTTAQSSTTNKTGKSAETRKGYRESKEILDELSRWKHLAIFSTCVLVFLIVFLVVWWIIKRRKNENNKVTPPSESPDLTDKPKITSSYNNLSYDSEDGKRSYEDSKCTRVIKTPSEADKVVGNTPEQNDTPEDKGPDEPHSEDDHKLIGNELPSWKESGEKGRDKQMNGNGIISGTGSGEKGRYQHMNGNGIPSEIASGEKGRYQHTNGNGIPSGTGSREKGRQRHRNKHKDKENERESNDRPRSNVSDDNTLPPLKSPGNIERRANEFNERVVNADCSV